MNRYLKKVKLLTNKLKGVFVFVVITNLSITYCLAQVVFELKTTTLQ